ncbi:hypothetical protein W911_13315 [Hyphomicrobium nitrativorans NL23]|uniref:Uncharacterized protein n=1 Tax=Hyphomicrobium nitrativorans NL23 TaxID=1029756 RepID=V5SIG8_9HYPH|nr:hypothetical protein W911_13315 [Hyphomicrobium nitrativorans NL23]
MLRRSIAADHPRHTPTAQQFGSKATRRLCAAPAERQRGASARANRRVSQNNREFMFEPLPEETDRR